MLVIASLLVKVRICFRCHRLYFRNCDKWQEANEKQEQNRKESKGSHVGHNIDNCRRIISPAARKEITCKRRYNNHKALKPHADVNENRNDPDHSCVLPNHTEPEELRRNHIT